MRILASCLAATGVLCALTGPLPAQEGPADVVAQGCKQEIDTYCKDVTKGEGRVLACLYAREDKLSTRCEYALYEASAQLERAVNAMVYLSQECGEDLRNFCKDVAPGEGRLLACVQKNEAKLSARCKQARKDVGVK